MNKHIIALCLLLAAPVTRAESVGSWVVVIPTETGTVKERYFMESGKPHELGENEYRSDYPFPQVLPKYWKKQGADWVEMSAAEKQAVDDAEADADNRLDNDTKKFLKALMQAYNEKLPASERVSWGEFKKAYKEQ